MQGMGWNLSRTGKLLLLKVAKADGVNTLDKGKSVLVKYVNPWWNDETPDEVAKTDIRRGEPPSSISRRKLAYEDAKESFYTKLINFCEKRSK